MQCRVLGPLEVTVDGGVVELGGRKQRAVLGLLLAAGGRVVSVDRLVDELWGEDPSPKALASVQSYVAHLRRALEPRRESRSPARVLVTRSPGYALVLPPSSVDSAAFERQAAAARELLVADPARAQERLVQAMQLWRGDAYADVAGLAHGLAAEAARLEELRIAAVEDGWRAGLALGGHTDVIGEIESFLVTHPLREDAWGLLAVALYRAQRQGDALNALRRARTLLAEEIGVDPGPELRRLERAVLEHDESLQAPRASAPILRSGSPTTPTRELDGRDAELARLTGCLEAAAAGRGGLVLLTGPAGIGKTGVARAVSSIAAGMGLRSGWGRCEQLGGATAMWPWSQALAELVATVSADRLRAQAALLAPASALLSAIPHSDHAPPDPDADTAAFRLAEAVTTLLRDTVGPALLILDDLHWADADTLGLLRRVAARLATLPTVVVATARDTDADVGPVLSQALGELARHQPVRVRLSGLRPVEVTALLRLRHGEDVPVAVAAAIHQRTGGNPFYLCELARLLAERGTLTDPGAVLSAAVPDGVREVVRDRLTRLPSGTQPLMAVAAISGTVFDLATIEAASGLDADTAAAGADAALRCGLIVEETPGRYRFAHDLVRDAVLAGIEASRRARLHGRLAEAIEQVWPGALDDRLDELAHHHDRAGSGHARQAWTYGVRAAARAASRSATADAARLYEVATAAMRRDPSVTSLERQQVLVGLMAARKRVGQERAAWRCLHEAADIALSTGDVVGAARAAATITVDTVWSWREYQIVDDASVALFERLLAALPADEAMLRARLLATLAMELYYAPDAVDRSVAMSDEALALARAVGAPDDVTRVLELRHVVLDRPQHLVRRLTDAEELVMLAETTGDPAAIARSLVYRGKNRLEASAVRAGAADYARARELAQAHGIVPVLVAVDFADAALLIARGEFAAAEAAIEQVSILHAGTTLPGADALPTLLRATVQLARDSLDEAVPTLATAGARAPELFGELHALALVRAGRRGEARSVLGPWDQQRELPSDYLWPARVAIRAMLWSELAPAAAARDLLRKVAPYSQRVAIAGTGIAVLGHLGHAAGLLARACGDLDQAVDLLRAALQDDDEVGWRPFALRSARELAATLRRRGRPDDEAEAIRHDRWAAELAAELGAADRAGHQSANSGVGHDAHELGA